MTESEQQNGTRKRGAEKFPVYAGLVIFFIIIVEAFVVKQVFQSPKYFWDIYTFFSRMDEKLKLNGIVEKMEKTKIPHYFVGKSNQNVVLMFRYAKKQETSGVKKFDIQYKIAKGVEPSRIKNGPCDDIVSVKHEKIMQNLFPVKRSGTHDVYSPIFRSLNENDDDLDNLYMASINHKIAKKCQKNEKDIVLYFNDQPSHRMISLSLKNLSTNSAFTVCLDFPHDGTTEAACQVWDSWTSEKAIKNAAQVYQNRLISKIELMRHEYDFATAVKNFFTIEIQIAVALLLWILLPSKMWSGYRKASS